MLLGFPLISLATFDLKRSLLASRNGNRVTVWNGRARIVILPRGHNEGLGINSRPVLKRPVRKSNERPNLQNLLPRLYSLLPGLPFGEVVDEGD